MIPIWTIVLTPIAIAAQDFGEESLVAWYMYSEHIQLGARQIKLILLTNHRLLCNFSTQ